MRRMAVLAAFGFVLLAVLPAAVRAQDDGPPNRVVTVTKFQVPFGDRGEFFDWMEEYIHPFAQLNPHVLNYRVLVHNWGSNGADVLLVAEYADFGDIEAECGQPCDDWDEAHQPPAEGSPERAHFDAMQDKFNEVFGTHSDEIYTSLSEQAVVEGEPVGNVGPDPEDEDDDGM